MALEHGLDVPEGFPNLVVRPKQSGGAWDVGGGLGLDPLWRWPEAKKRGKSVFRVGVSITIVLDSDTHRVLFFSCQSFVKGLSSPSS